MLKVLKYDWRCGWNNVRTTLVIALILSALLGVITGLMGGEPIIDDSNFLLVGSESSGTFLGILAIVWFSVMVALFVQTIIAFFHNMVGRMFGAEGYLTHTLPVDTWKLLLGKNLGTWIFGVFMVFIAFACVMLVMIFAVASTGYMGDYIGSIIQFLPKLGAYHFQQLMTGAGYALYGFAAFLAWSFLIVVQFQFICIAARQFGRFHVVGGFIVFIVLGNIESWLNNGSSMGFLVFLLVSVACFFGSSWLVKNRLNF